MHSKSYVVKRHANIMGFTAVNSGNKFVFAVH